MQEEAGSWCTTVEGFEAEVEAFIFGVQKRSPSSPEALLQAALSLRVRWMHLKLERSSSSSFPSGNFCIRLQHSLNLMLLRVQCL